MTIFSRTGGRQLRKVVFGVLFAFLLLGALVLAFKVGLVQAQPEVITINSDGSVTPSSAPISSLDNVTYTLTGSISNPSYNGVVVERSNMAINGAGYTIQGAYEHQIGIGNGIELANVSNVTIENVNVENCTCGIYVTGSNDTTISGCNSTANTEVGIELDNSFNNTISGNVATENYLQPIIIMPDENTFNSESMQSIGNGGIFLYGYFKQHSKRKHSNSKRYCRHYSRRLIKQQCQRQQRYSQHRR